MRSPTMLAAPVMLALALPAQGARVDPYPFTWTTAALETGFPFGHPTRRVLHYLEVHDGLRNQPRTVTWIALRRSPLDSQPVPAFRADLTMRLATATTTAATISPNFAANLGTDAMTVLPRRSVSFAASPGVSTTPAPFEYLLPADFPFVFRGTGPLAYELVMYDHTNPATTRFELYSEGHAHAGDVAPGCGGLALATQFTTGAVIHDASGVQPGTAVAAMFGARVDQSGGVPLPIDLSPIGATGCVLGIDPLFATSGIADANGAWRVTVPFTNPQLGGFYATQALALAPGANPLGLVSSNAQLVIPWTTRVAGRVWIEDTTSTIGQVQPTAALVIQVH